MAAPTTYKYTIPQISIDQFTANIENTAIVTALDHVTAVGTDISILFKDALSAGDKALLDGVVSNYVYAPPSQPPQQVQVIADSTVQKDSENAPIQRLKMAPAGTTYQLRSTEFETSHLGSLVNVTCFGNIIGDCTLALFDSNGATITDQGIADTSCVKTVMDFEPTYSYDVIGGKILYVGTCDQDVRLSVIAVPDIPAQAGGSKIMVCNANLRFVGQGQGIDADGRVSKHLEPHPDYHTNKLRFVLNHPAGYKLKLCVFLEHFKI